MCTVIAPLATTLQHMPHVAACLPSQHPTAQARCMVPGSTQASKHDTPASTSLDDEVPYLANACEPDHVTCNSVVTCIQLVMPLMPPAAWIIIAGSETSDYTSIRNAHALPAPLNSNAVKQIPDNIPTYACPANALLHSIKYHTRVKRSIPAPGQCL
jgi:hypothetical protein